jgi:hypothetical protein
MQAAVFNNLYVKCFPHGTSKSNTISVAGDTCVDVTVQVLFHLASLFSATGAAL